MKILALAYFARSDLQISIKNQNNMKMMYKKFRKK